MYIPRYAAMMGATVEFNKMEGISLDIKNNRLYLGISSVDKVNRSDIHIIFMCIHGIFRYICKFINVYI
jgi:hypothetical protein